MTPAHVWQLFPIPCSRSRVGPLPARMYARLCPCTTRDSRTRGGATGAVDHAAVADGLPAVRRPLARRVLVPVDEGQQGGGVGHHAEGVEPAAVEITVVDHAA